MRKDLAMARQLAAERHDLNYFKDILKTFMEAKENERLENEKSKEEKASLKEKKEPSDTKKTPKKPRKSRTSGIDKNIVNPPNITPKPKPEGQEVNPLSANSKRPAEEVRIHS